MGVKGKMNPTGTEWVKAQEISPKSCNCEIYHLNIGALS